MASRLQTERPELARLMGGATEEARRRTADVMVGRVVSQFTDPELVIPADGDALDDLIAELEEFGDKRDAFGRARAATSARYLRRGDFDEAVYEALHADVAHMTDSIAIAPSTLMR